MAQKRPTGTRPSRPRRAPRDRLGEGVLRGNALARIDDHGRLKLPAGFRRVLEESYGPALYLTSLTGDSMWVYPLTVWEERERRLLALSPQHPSVAKFQARVSYYGSEVELDAQGRFVVPALLRASARMEGEVAVLGSLRHLEVWNNDLFREKLAREPFTDDDQRALAELGL